MKLSMETSLAKYDKSYHTHHKAIAILDKDISDSAEAFEELLEVAVPDSKRKSSNIHTRPHHFL